MRSQTSLVAKQCLLQTWAAQIHECQNRPEGMSVEKWCQENNLTKANYYYRLRRVRQAYLDSMQEETNTFVELTAPVNPASIPKVSNTTADVSAILRTSQGISIELCDGASVNTDDVVHTARRFSARFSAFQCMLSAT